MTTWIDCTQAFIKPDIIRFTENVWSKPKSKRAKARVIGERIITASIRNLLDSDGYTHLTIVACEGEEPLEEGLETKRLRRNIIKNGLERLEWSEEEARERIINV